MKNLHLVDTYSQRIIAVYNIQVVLVRVSVGIIELDWPMVNEVRGGLMLIDDALLVTEGKRGMLILDAAALASVGDTIHSLASYIFYI